MPKLPTDKLVLVRSFKERTRLSFLCSGFAAFMGFMITEMEKWKPSGFMEHFVHVVGVDIFITFGLFSFVGLIWGLFAPAWLERALQRGYCKVLTIISVIAIGSVCSIVFYLVVR